MNPPRLPLRVSAWRNLKPAFATTALVRLDPACGGGSFPAPPTSCVGLPAAQAVASGGGASGYSGPWAVFAALLPVGKDMIGQIDLFVKAKISFFDLF